MVSLKNGIKIEIVSADIDSTIFHVSQNGILLKDINTDGKTVLNAEVSIKDYRKIKSIRFKNGEKMQIISCSGPFFFSSRLLKRPIFVIIFLVTAALSILLSTRVFFFNVSGNSKISSQAILDAAQYAGIYWGIPGNRICSEEIKNRMLSLLPDIEWVGVTVSGSVATIEVSECAPQPHTDQNLPVSSIVADQDGIIERMIVYRGSPCCTPGQAVKKGQILVSGYTDCGRFIRAEPADSEIYAKTKHNISAFFPSLSPFIRESDHAIKKYSLLIGKNLINLSLNSGISDAKCVKMYQYHYACLPGGLMLPLAILEEKQTPIHFLEDFEAQDLPEENFQKYAENYLKSHMNTGMILSADSDMQRINGGTSFCGIYHCMELIGKNIVEERIPSGQNG